jgi:sulfoxide reductase heme-binding subunit YedZ
MKKTIIFVLIFFAVYIAIVIFFSLLFPHFLGNALGFAALFGYLLTLFPSLLRKLFNIKNNLLNNWLLKYRRHIGVASFGFAINHVVASINITDLVDVHKYAHYRVGLSLIFILGLLTFTSNNWSVKMLKRDWKKLHQLTYLIILLLPLHIIDKMSGKFNRFTYIEMISVIFIGILSICRLLLKSKETTFFEFQRF